MSTGYNPAAYKIWSRGEFGRFEMVQYYTSFKYSLKWGDVSTWELVIPTSEFQRIWYQDPITTYVFAWGGIIVYRNDDYLIGGPILSATRTKSGDDDMITLSGASDTHWMSQRIIWPSYIHQYAEAGHGTETYQWYYSNDIDLTPFQTNWDYPAEEPTADIIRQLVDISIGPSAWHGTLTTHAYDRRFQWTYGGITQYITMAAENHLGPDATYTGRLESLLEACKGLSHASDSATPLADEVDFYIKNTSDGVLTFDTTAITDKSNKALFGDDLGTIRSFELTETRPDANSLIIGGDQESTGPETRIFNYTEPQVATDSISMYGRVEAFFDYSPLEGQLAQRLADMRQAGITELNERAYNITATLTLEDSDQVKFLDNYNIGYLVSVEFGDFTFTDVIRQIDGTVDPQGGDVIQPVISTARKYRRHATPWSGILDARTIAKNLARYK